MRKQRLHLHRNQDTLKSTISQTKFSVVLKILSFIVK